MSIIHLIPGLWIEVKKEPPNWRQDLLPLISNLSSQVAVQKLEFIENAASPINLGPLIVFNYHSSDTITVWFIGQAVRAQTVRTQLTALLGQAPSAYQPEFPLQWPSKAVKHIILLWGMMRYDLVTPVYTVYSTTVLKVMSPTTFALYKDPFYSISIFCPI